MSLHSRRPTCNPRGGSNRTGGTLTRITSLIAFACAALVLAGSARPALTVGVSEDRGKDTTATAAQFFQTLQDVGLAQNRVSIVWNPARQRQPVGQEQHLPLSDSLPPRPRGRLSEQRPGEAADGPARVPPLPGAQHRPAPDRLHLAERGGAEPEPDQAGRLGRVQRHGAADLQGSRQDAVQPAAPARPRRARLAGSAAPAARRHVHRHRERSDDRRGNPGDVLHRVDPECRVRPDRRLAQLLPAGRRARAHALAERHRARRRLEAALLRRGQEGDPRLGRDVPERARGRLEAHRRCSLPGRTLGRPQARPTWPQHEVGLQGGRKRGGGLQGGGLQGHDEQGKDPERAAPWPAEGTAGRARDDQGKEPRRRPPAKQAQGRALPLRDPDAGDHEPRAHGARRQSALPGPMSEPRAARLAELIVGYSLELQPGKVLRVDAAEPGIPLAVELYRAALRAGAHAYVEVELERLNELLIKEGSGDQLDFVPPAAEIEVDRLDAIATIWSEGNTRALGEAPPERQQRLMAAERKLITRRWGRIAKGELRWCGALFPSQAHAQDAGMSLAEYERFVYRACHVEEDGDAVGLNYEIDRFTNNTLFDEKIGGTMHVALGASFKELGGTNDSALHWDMVCDLREDGEVFADDELIWKAGRFIAA